MRKGKTPILLLANGTIAIMDPAHPMVEAAVVDNTHFVYVGDRADAEGFARRSSREAWKTLDLQGRSVASGFNDSHLHFIHYVEAKLPINPFGCTPLIEVQECLRGGLAGSETDSGRWFLGEGWSQEQFAGEQHFLTRRELDQVSTEYPILILHSCSHAGVPSSRAPKLLHINRDMMGCYDAFAKVDETGAPNGAVKENILDDTKAAIPFVGLRPLLEQVVQPQHDLLAEGLTSIQSDDSKYTPDERPYTPVNGLRELAGRGALKLRFAGQVLLTESETLEELFTRDGACFGGDNRFYTFTMKLLADGSLGARVAFLWEPYFDAPDTCGLPIYSEQAQLDRLAATAHRHGMAIAIHAIEDGAAEMVLSAFQRIHAKLPWLHPHHGMVHCQVLSEGQLHHMAELDVTAFIQLVFANGDMHIAPGRLGGNRLVRSHAWGDMERLGLHMAFGTDRPMGCFHPLEEVYCTATRRNFTGNGPFLPEQALIPYQALYACTIGGTYASDEKHIRRRIRSGLLADFLLVDRNLLTCPPEELLSAWMLRTYVGGMCVFRNPSS